MQVLSLASQLHPLGTPCPRPPTPCSGRSASSAAAQAACYYSSACCGPSRSAPRGLPDGTRITSPGICTISLWSPRRRRATGSQRWLPSPPTRRPCAARWLRDPRHHLRSPWREAWRTEPRGMPCWGPSAPRRPATRASLVPVKASVGKQCLAPGAPAPARLRPQWGKLEGSPWPPEPGTEAGLLVASPAPGPQEALNNPLLRNAVVVTYRRATDGLE